MKIALLIVGILGILLGLGVSGVSYGLHLANRPRISFKEALPGILGGAGCSCLSVPIAVGGLMWILLAQKEGSKRDPDDRPT